MKIENRPIDQIKPYPGNAKRHKIKWIAKSIEKFDFDQPIVVDGSGVIIKGHGRFEAAKLLKMETVPVIVRTDLTEEQIRLSRIADNRCAQGGGIDSAALSAELDALKLNFEPIVFDSLGFNDAFLRKLSKEDLFFDFSDGHSVADDAPEPSSAGQKRFALSIVLTEEQNAAWSAYKEDCGKKTDTAAFLELLKQC